MEAEELMFNLIEGLKEKATKEEIATILEDNSLLLLKIISTAFY